MAANPHPISELSFDITKNVDETFVHCHGRIVSNTVHELRSKVGGLIPGTKTVVLDLTKVTYLDSSGLGALAGIYLSAKRQECELKLINLNQRLKELFRLTKLAKIFEGHEEMLGMTPD
jgi:anti-sigma B factor antagonist